MDAVLNGQATTGSYYNGTLTIGNYVLVANTPANVIVTGAMEPVRDLAAGSSATWTFNDGNTIAVTPTIAQNEFLFTSQGQAGVIKLLATTPHGTREISYWRQTSPSS